MTVAELGERMDAPEFMRWIERDDSRQSDAWTQTALICLTMRRIVGDDQARLEDFMPSKAPPAVVGPAPDLDSRLLAWATARAPQPSIPTHAIDQGIRPEGTLGEAEGTPEEGRQ